MMPNQKKDMRIDKQTGFIYHGDVFIGRLNDSELRVFIRLYEENGALVSKDDLLSAGWPGRVVVPNSLNMSIRKLRSLLLTEDNETIIQTVARQGFRLIPGMVTVSAPSVGNTIGPELDNSVNVSSEKTTLAKPRHKFHLLVVAISFILTIGSVIYYLHGDSIDINCHEQDGVWLCGLDEPDSEQCDVIKHAPSDFKHLDKDVYIYGRVCDKEGSDTVKVK